MSRSSPEHISRYNRTAYMRRVDEGRCAKCGRKLRPNYTYKTCAECRQEVRVYAALWRKENGPTGETPIESPRDRTPGCIRCGLRGEHVCLRGNASDRRPW